MYVHTRDEKLREAILKKFRSFADFACVVGDHPTYVSHFVHRRRKMTAERAARWAETLGCKPGELLGEAEPFADVHRRYRSLAHRNNQIIKWNHEGVEYETHPSGETSVMGSKD